MMKQLSLGDLGIGAKRRNTKKAVTADTANRNLNRPTRTKRQQVDYEEREVLELDSDESDEKQSKPTGRSRKCRTKAAVRDSSSSSSDGDSVITVNGFATANDRENESTSAIELDAKWNEAISNKVYTYREFKEDFYPPSLLSHAVHVNHSADRATEHASINKRFSFRLMDEIEISPSSDTSLLHFAEISSNPETSKQESVTDLSEQIELDFWLDKLQSTAESSVKVRELYDSLMRKRDAQVSSRGGNPSEAMWTDAFAPTSFDEFALLTNSSDANSIHQSLFDWTSAWTEHGVVKKQPNDNKGSLGHDAADSVRRSTRLLTQQLLVSTCNDSQSIVAATVEPAPTGANEASDAKQSEVLLVKSESELTLDVVEQAPPLKRVSFLAEDSPSSGGPRRSARTRGRAQQSVPSKWYDDAAVTQIETSSGSDSDATDESDILEACDRELSDEDWAATPGRAHSKRRRRRKRSRARRDLDNCRILVGGFGCGKSALIYALATQLQFNVIELSADCERNGRAIQQSLNEATQSRRVFTVQTPAGHSTSNASNGNCNLSPLVDTAVSGTSRARRKRDRGQLDQSNSSKVRDSSHSRIAKANGRKRRRLDLSGSSDTESKQVRPESLTRVTRTRRSRASEQVGQCSKYVPADEIDIDTQSSMSQLEPECEDRSVAPKKGRPARTASLPATGQRSDSSRPSKLPAADASAKGRSTLDSFWKRQPDAHQPETAASTEKNKRRKNQEVKTDPTTQHSSSRTPSEPSVGSKKTKISDSNLLNYFSVSASSAQKGKGSAATAKAGRPKVKATEPSSEESKPCETPLAGGISAGDNIANNAPTVSVAVSKSGTLILFEEADVVFEEFDRGFWLAIEQLVLGAKRPIVLCTDEAAFSDTRCAPLVELSDKFQINPTFLHLNVERVSIYVQVLAAVHGLLLDKRNVSLLLEYTSLDIRKISLLLQFWLGHCVSLASTEVGKPLLRHCPLFFEKVTGLTSLDITSPCVQTLSTRSLLLSDRSVSSCFRLLEHIWQYESAFRSFSGCLEECVVDELLTQLVSCQQVPSSVSLRRVAKLLGHYSLVDALKLRGNIQTQSIAAAVYCYAAKSARLGSSANSTFAVSSGGKDIPDDALIKCCNERQRSLADCALPIENTVFVLHKSILHADYVPFMREMLRAEARGGATGFRPFRTRLHWTDLEWQRIRHYVLYETACSDSDCVPIASCNNTAATPAE